MVSAILNPWLCNDITKKDAEHIEAELRKIAKDVIVDIQGDTPTSYIDIRAYGKDFNHKEYGPGCYVACVSLNDSPTIADGSYASIHFNTIDGDWIELNIENKLHTEDDWLLISKIFLSKDDQNNPL